MVSFPVATTPMRSSIVFLHLFFFCLSCPGHLRVVGAQPTLARGEVEVLKQIDSRLRLGWDFSVDPCSGRSGWVAAASSATTSNRNLTCQCSTATKVCRVVSILLKSQNLTGTLPPEFSNLTSLAVLDLTRNVFHGPIPASWGSLPLTNLSLPGNLISGGIPKEIGHISTLQALALDNNLLSGPIPAELGNLTNLEKLVLSANDLIGELPDSLGKLTNITDFRIDGTGISGVFPSFIGNLSKLQRIDIQGTSMEGPFPFQLSNLNLTELRLTDFRGDGSFPPLQNMNIRYLILRNCSISGKLPSYIGGMTNLKILDLSFNKFTSEIPSAFANLNGRINNMYLTSNMLNGSIPDWILGSIQSIDISYNNFTGLPAPRYCQQSKLNLAASYSSLEGNSIETCLNKNFPCSGKAKNYNLFINCGGKKETVDGQIYEEDASQQGVSIFSANQNWAYSSTGDFFNNGLAKYIATNTTPLNMTNAELYMNARLCPSSLKYYGFCLQNGNYTIKLHFAEIVFTDDQTFQSVGRRFFDVSIQGVKVLKDFNIAEAANGTSRAIVKNFTALVESNSLEIHFQWAGKGTNAIPDKGVYGPLISAISVTPDFKPAIEHSLSAAAIAGIVIGACVAAFLVVFFMWLCIKKRQKQEYEIERLKLQTSHFSLRQIKKATGNFAPANKIGEGGFGPVYKGILADASLVAVKQLSAKSRQGNREFINEIGMISALQHPHLVRLMGCCIEDHQLLLVYEYMENNSLAHALFGLEEKAIKLEWKTRHKICLGIAKGLAFLHEESGLKIVHRDIKATNILLDKDLTAKISDFGLAKLDDEENTHISTRIAGTFGYMAPEYAMRGYLTDKADVYSFGVVLLEVISGKSNTNYRPKDEFVYLLDWAFVLEEKGNLVELVDSRLGLDYPKEEAQQMLKLALICANPSPSLRPKMTEVVSILENGKPVRVPSVKLVQSEEEKSMLKGFQKLTYDSPSTSRDSVWQTQTNQQLSNSMAR